MGRSPNSLGTATTTGYPTRIRDGEANQRRGPPTRLTAETDPNGHTTRYGEYGPVGSPASIVDQQGHRTRLGYDSIGNFVSIIDARGKTTRAYDVFGRPGSVKTPKDQDARDYLFTPTGPRIPSGSPPSSTTPQGTWYGRPNHAAACPAAAVFTTTFRFDAKNQVAARGPANYLRLRRRREPGHLDRSGQEPHPGPDRLHQQTPPRPQRPGHRGH